MLSIWEKETFLAPQDVIIAGSGFVGLWCALYLKKRAPQLKITILERGLIPSGASTRNAGFACFGSLGELVADEAKMGASQMLQLVEMRYKGLLLIQKYFSNLQIDFERCGGYELFDSRSKTSLEQLKTNIDHVNALMQQVTGTRHTFRLDDNKIELFGFGQTSHLIKNNLEGYLHSGKLLQALLQYVQSKGVRVYNGIEIMDFLHNGSSQLEIRTNHAFSFSSKKLLICTNAFAKELIPDIDIAPARGQVLLTSPIHNLTWKGTFHSDEGFYYFRDLGNRILLGGARNKALLEEETTELNITGIIQSELERYLAEVILPRYKNQYQVDYRWSGIMAMGSGKMPIIQQIQPNVFCAVRMSGMGVALAPIVGRMISNMIVD